MGHALLRLDLADDLHAVAAALLKHSAHGEDILGTAHEGGGHEVRPKPRGHLQVAHVIRLQGVHAQGHAGQVDLLAGLQIAAVFHPAAHGPPLHIHTAQRDVAVVQEDGLTGMHVQVQARVVHADALGVARSHLGMKGEVLPPHEGHATLRKGPDADLRATGVDENPQGVLGLGGTLGQHSTHAALEVPWPPVGQVQPGHVHTGRAQLGEHLWRLAGRSDGGHDLGPSHTPTPHGPGAGRLTYPAESVTARSYRLASRLRRALTTVPSGTPTTRSPCSPVMRP